MTQLGLPSARTMLVAVSSVIIGRAAHAQLQPCGTCPRCPPGYSCMTFSWIEVCDSMLLPPDECDSPSCADTCRVAADVCTPEFSVPVYSFGGDELCARLDGVKFCGLERTINERLCFPNEVSGGSWCSCTAVIGQTWCPLAETYQWYSFGACD